jgi:hypothetical protein
MNTGAKQSTIAYKVAPNGQPVDINGQLISVSGRKQAIALMIGILNPNPDIYEVEYYFNPGEFINGTPSTTIDLYNCPISIFNVAPNIIYLYPGVPSKTVEVTSNMGWDIVGTIAYASADPSTGGLGTTTVTITRTATLGEGDIIFRDIQTGETKKLRVLNTDADGWILATGFWNNARVWTATGLWNY